MRRRSAGRRFCVTAAVNIESSRKTFQRFRDFVRSRDTKIAENELQSYSSESHKLRNDVLDEFEYCKQEGGRFEFVHRHVGPVLWEGVDCCYKHAQRLFQRSKDGQVITRTDVWSLGRRPSTDGMYVCSQYVKELEICMTPKVRAIFGLFNVGVELIKTVVISAAVVIALGFCGVDIFENFTSPVYGWRVDWLYWTVPYAIVTYFFWNSAISRNWDSLMGFKLSTSYQYFRQFVMKNARSYTNSALLLRSIHFAWLTTLFQGVGFYTFEAAYPTLYGTDFYTIGFSIVSPLPSIAWLPVEVLFIGSVSGVCHIVADWSLMVPAEDILADRRRFSSRDSRIGAKNVLQFDLLNDPQISRDRATVTFLYYFVCVGYLSVEAIWVHSLFASMATLAIGHYLTFKGMQKSNT